MTNPVELLKQRYNGPLLAMLAALEADDVEAFNKELETVMQARETGLWTQLRKLSSDLSNALERFQLDSRLVDLAEKEVPDAKSRLAHVMKMTDEAAHKTMDLAELSGKLAGNVGKEVTEIDVLWKTFRARKIAVADFAALLKRMDQFLASAQTDVEVMRKNMAEVLLAQGFQDLTGQIIRGVITLVGEIETALGTLLQMAQIDGLPRTPRAEEQPKNNSQGFGPVVPGVDHGVVVDGQQDIDDLLSGLGV